MADASLVIATPSGTDSNRRQTRSQTRGTPAPPPAPTPAKKPALEKPASNGSTKGRRGRPPKSANEEKLTEPVISEDSFQNEKQEETKVESEVEKEVKEETKLEKVNVDDDSTSRPEVPKSSVPVKEEVPNPEAKVELVQNSQEPEKPKEKVTLPTVEKVVTEAGEKPADGENKLVNNSDTTVNNHEKVKICFF